LKPYHTHELDFRSQECVFLGYSSSHKGYKYLSSTGRIYISKDVLFNELRFPYLDLFSSSSSSTQNITSYFNLNPDLSSPVSASTPSLSQIPSSNSLSAPSVPSDFSVTALNQTSSESTSTHPQSSNTVSSSESIPTAPSPTHPQSSNTMSHSESVSTSTLIPIKV